ncbi:MAG: hypothetical protein R6T89_06370 [Candidatus Syntrophosphaera sp.]
MKTTIRIILLVILGISMFLATSCSSDEDKPTTPNFEEFTPHVWDYDHVIWFDLDYNYADKLGNTVASINLTCKGEDSEAILKINNQLVEFDYVQSYTNGKLYYGAEVELNTNQQVTYWVDRNGTIREGTINVGEFPEAVLGSFPEFEMAYNYSPAWVFTNEDDDDFEDPDFQLIQAGVSQEYQYNEHIRQIDGDERDYLLVKDLWADFTDVDDFYFEINAIKYKMRNSNKVLTVGVSWDYYWWSIYNKANADHQRATMSQIMEMIHNHTK